MVDVDVDDPAGDWTAPGIFAVADGVYRIPLPLPMDGLRAVNVYAVADGDRLALVDSGMGIGQAREQLVAALDRLGVGLGEVDQILVTHVHRDHYTLGLDVRREFGARLALGVGEQASMDVLVQPERDGHAQLELLVEAGATELVGQLGYLGKGRREFGWEPPDTWLANGAETVVGERTLKAIATPGHTRGHVVFADQAAGLLFAGDHVLPHITPSIGFEPAPPRSPLRDFLGSLERVRALPDMRLLPAHGPVADSVHARVDALLEHHDQRLDASWAAVKQGADTAYAAAGRLTWTRRGRALAELDPFNAMLAVLETMSHLEVLVAQGRLSRADSAGVRHYTVR